MFTGLVAGCGVVRALEASPSGQRLVLETPFADAQDPLMLGESVAVDGCCLTVSGVASGTGKVLSFDVVPTTLARTTLGDLSAGARVNLERSLRLGDRLGGHLVAGHVDGVARIERVERSPDGAVMVTLAPERSEDQLLEGMIPRGSVALAGVSLTIARLDSKSFTVALIPVTLAITNLGADLVPGRRLNVETDMLGKYARRSMERAD